MKPNEKILKFAPIVVCFGLLALSSACGRAPSRLLRQGQLPVSDFPLYLSEGVPGKIWKYDRDAARTELVSGLSDPRGIATDRFGALFVVEQGANRLIKVNTSDGSYTVIATSLSTPSVVAVDSFGEAWVAQDGAQNVIRASDGKVLGTFSAIPSALAFGVDDLPIVGLFDANRVYWGASESASHATITNPANAALDGQGRVYVTEGTAANARLLRFHQTEPGGEGAVIVDALTGPLGIAVDPAGNTYVVEQGAARVVLASHEGRLYTWASNVIDPQYLAFTQY